MAVQSVLIVASVACGFSLVAGARSSEQAGAININTVIALFIYGLALLPTTITPHALLISFHAHCLLAPSDQSVSPPSTFSCLLNPLAMDAVPTIASSMLHAEGSPRRALQSLSPNKPLIPRPQRGAQKHPQLLSPFKIAGSPSRPASAAPVASTARVESPAPLTTGKKRSYDDALGPDEHNGRQPAAYNSSQTHASFSSLINYDPPSSAPAHSSPPPLSSPSSTSTDATAADAPPVLPTPMLTVAPTAQQRAEVLRLRLRMAMFRVRTNQLRVPLEDLAVQQRQQEDGGLRREDGSVRPEEGTPASPSTPLRARQTAAPEHASITGGGSPVAEVEGGVLGS